MLFPERLKQIIPNGRSAGVLDEILRGLNWSKWKQLFRGSIGQPPIHPRILAGVILYGYHCRLRSSRSLEEALIVCTDFHWLVERRAIDPTALSEFRHKNSAALKYLFVQIVLIARSIGHVPLTSLGFDATPMRAGQ